MGTSRITRLGALAGIAGLLTLGLSGCFGGGAAPQCSAGIVDSFEESGTAGTVTSEFPAPELLVGGGIYCWLAIESEGSVGGIAFFEGANGDEVATARLEANGFTASELLPSFYEKGDLIAGVTPSEGALSADDGVPAELVGKELAILFVGAQP